jgi:hypothetical protein
MRYVCHSDLGSVKTEVVMADICVIVVELYALNIKFIIQIVPQGRLAKEIND